MMKPRRDAFHKLRILKYAEDIGSVVKTCRYFGVGRASFYRWKAAYEKSGEAGLVDRPSTPINPANQKPKEIIDKIIHLREKYHLGPIRITWYLERYHDIKISDACVYRILKRNGLSWRPRGVRLREVHTRRYQKQVPGHQIQVDVKFVEI